MAHVHAILDFPGERRAVFRDPVRIVTAATIAAVRHGLREVDHATRRGLFAVGFVAYEAAPAFDTALVTRPHSGPAPLLWFALFERSHAADPSRGGPAVLPQLTWETDTARVEYDAAIDEIRNGIAAGDVYQVNHSIRFRAPCTTEPRDLYDALVAPQHGRYHALIETADWAIVSVSPELFMDIRGGIVTTRPMKGTMRRGRWLQEDRRVAEQLALSTKDRAENLMIVDLLRNDLGRVADFGTVHVLSMFDVETYPTVHQMTSTVTAQLREDVQLDDVFAATFPCGSVTGAPKVTAMRSIARLERSPRGPYCGAIGVVRPDGSATFNVAIRTLTLDRLAGVATYGAGGGITWDSHADAEYDEVIMKAALIEEPLPAFDLLETMRLEDGAYARLPLHLERLAESAEYWGFTPDTVSNAHRALEVERALAGAGAWRVRLTASRTGNIHITRSPLQRQPTLTLPTVALASRPVSARDRMLFHKTTARALYDELRNEQPGAFDVLLHNEEGFVTEFSIGNIVAEMNGALLTPARASGLLAGTFREQLLREGIIREAKIRVADLATASRIWFINSVREWVEVDLRS